MYSFPWKLCHAADLKPGMRLGQDIIGPDDHLALLNAGTKLTARQIRRICSLNLAGVSIMESTARPQKTGNTGNVAAQYNETVATIEKAFNHIKLFNEVPVAAMQELVVYSLQPITETQGTLSYLHLLQQKDQYTFQHSVNVAIICGVLGKWCGFKGVELLELILAGLLHDVGKALLSDELLSKPGKLTAKEFDEIKRHPAAGYVLLEGTDLPLRVKHGILQHHERLDGIGYPMGLREGAVNDYAKIIAVADTFDAITSERCYQKKRTPLTAVDIIAEQMFKKLDARICLTFLNKTRDSFVGDIVQLSDGRTAEIICFRIQASKPIVKTEDGTIIDLSRSSHVSLVGLENP